jgi:S-formylglutathione hydrolase FrmB
LAFLRRLSFALAVLVAQVLPAYGEPIPTTTIAVATPGRPVLDQAGLYIPPSLDPSRPVQLLVVLHGQGGTGPAIVERLRPCADEHGWVMVAPTMAYRDYMDAEQVRLDGQQNIPSVHSLLQQVRQQQMSDMPFQDRLLVYGFSRGGQMAHRLAMFYPDEIEAVATVSAGSYTLPRSSLELTFPYGVADLVTYRGDEFDAERFVRIPFWVGVGGADTIAAETARAWDRFEGSTRVDRARHFADALTQLGSQVSLNIFGGIGHEETAAMRANACSFLAAHAADQSVPAADAP